MKKSIKYSLLAIVLFSLSACSLLGGKEFSIQKDLEKQLQTDFKELGYQGKVSVIEYKEPWFLSPYLVYRYEEKVDGEVLHFEDVLDVDSDTNQIEVNSGTNWFSVEEIGMSIDMEMIKSAMWRQPDVKKKFKQIEKAYQVLETDNVTLKRVEGSLTGTIKGEDDELVWEDVLDGQRRLLAQFKTNQERNLPLNGYYNVDVKPYLMDHTLQIDVDFEILVEDLDDWELEEEKAFVEKWLKAVDQVDYSSFWDGYYNVSLSWRSKSGGRQSSIWDGIVLDIRDGKIYRKFSPM